jgi:hypothetical protein
MSNRPALPFTDPAGCTYLDDKSPCGEDYYGYPIKGSLIPGSPKDYPAIVSYLSSFSSRYSETYTCSANTIAPQVEELRYQTSLTCAKVRYRCERYASNLIFF